MQKDLTHATKRNQRQQKQRHKKQQTNTLHKKQTKTWHARDELNTRTQTWRLRQACIKDKRNKDIRHELSNKHTHDTWHDKKAKQIKLWHMEQLLSVTQHSATHCNTLSVKKNFEKYDTWHATHCSIGLLLSVLPCVAGCCSVLQCVAAYMYQVSRHTTPLPFVVFILSRR